MKATGLWLVLDGNKVLPLFFYSQTGEGMSEEGCGADEG